MNVTKKSIVTIRVSLLLAAVLGFSACCATEKSSSSFQSRAKISREQAQQIALSKAPGGALKSGGTTEVAVDAMTGDMVFVDQEHPAQAAQEKKAK